MRAATIGLCLLLAACASPRAAELEPDGMVVIDITIGTGGVVERTQLVSEDPKGKGFAVSADQAIKRYAFEDSEPGTYRITIKFRLDEDGKAVPEP